MKYSSTIKLILPWLVFALVGCTRSLDVETATNISSEDTTKLIQQIEGKACYWDEQGQVLPPTIVPGMFNAIACRKNVTMILRDLAASGVRIQQALPALISNLKVKNTENYPGHRVKAGLPSLSTRTLGMIADSRAIDGLLEFARESKKLWPSVQQMILNQ
jgi:hypothetical protein